MVLNLYSSSIIIFDLDDTLYKEVDYVYSAFLKVSETLSPFIGDNLYDELINLFNLKADVFGNIIDKYKIKEYSKNDLLNIYRTHFPNISLVDSAREFLDRLKRDKIKMGLITDGRSVTQRNKLKALRIEEYFDDIIISEEFGSAKPDVRNFQYFEDKYRGSDLTYIADNTEKDFIAPNLLRWNTICMLDNGTNIHKQDLDCDKNKAPQYFIQTFHDMEIRYEF